MKMKYCCVPGCKSKSSDKLKKLCFYYLPNDCTNGIVNPVQQRRRWEWIKAIRGTRLSAATLKNITVCSKHFSSGQPAREEYIYHKDWIPNRNMPRIVLEQKNESVENIIENLPEVIVQFDVPEYIILDRLTFNEKKIEMDLIQKYITSPICDENGHYIYDHDYLGLPVLPIKTEPPYNNTDEDHSYSIAARPACLYFDSRHFCNICARNCINLFCFNNHMMAHTLKNHVTCEICHQKFLTTTCLNTHLMIHTALCEKCGNEVPIVQLKAHQQANKKQKYQNADIMRYKIPDKKKTYFCVLCMKTFFNSKEYLGHLFVHKKGGNKLKSEVML